MQILKTKSLTANQSAQINQLWNEEYPVNLTGRFPLLLEGVDEYEHYLIEDEQQVIKAWAVVFNKEAELRFSIIVRSSCGRQGLGSVLIQKLKQDHPIFYGWVIDHNNDLKTDGSHYLSPVAFYQKHKFIILETMRVDNQFLSAVKIKWQA